MMKVASMGWFGILRLGLVQAALGSIVVLATSTMNRIMVVELALPATIPAALVALHYAVQILRPRFGFGSDVGGGRVAWIIGGIAVLGIGATIAASAIAFMSESRALGIALAVVGFTLIGAGVGAAGTSLLVLLAKRVDEKRRVAAATVVWLMLIVGFVVTTILVGKFLDPYSAPRLIIITATVSIIALALTSLSVHGLDVSGGVKQAVKRSASEPSKSGFLDALKEVWSEPQARRFTLFVFISMLAYSGQELILEPFAGTVFEMTPGQSTQLSGVQHGGVLVGMILVNVACALLRGTRLGSLRNWTIIGCLASALALLTLALASSSAQMSWPLRQNVFVLGMANGAFAVSAIGSMMSLAGSGRKSREGMRMGLWGAAQAVAFGMGGFLGAAGSDLARMLVASRGGAYGFVFAGEAILFVVAAGLAAKITSSNVLNESETALAVSTHATAQQGTIA